MSRHIKTYGLVALCCVSTLLWGCFPDECLEWSADGSTGILRLDGGLSLVDGASGAITPLQVDGEVGIMPDISADARQIAYVVSGSCPSVEEGLRRFPTRVAEMVKRDAAELAEKILAGATLPKDLLAGGTATSGRTEAYHHWVVRVMCEAPSAELATRLGQDKLQECRECGLVVNDLIVAERQDPSRKEIVTTMPVMLLRPRFSPDGRNVAYLVTAPDDEDRTALAVATLGQESRAMQVCDAVAIGFDWRADGRALAYVKQDGDEMLAVIEESIVIDEKGDLAGKASSGEGQTCLYEMLGDGEKTQLVGSLFQATMHVLYGPGGRMLFSSAAAEIPISTLGEPEYSLFCYDRVTGAVSDILPGMIRKQTNTAMNFFSLSPDGKRLLVPLTQSRFAIYELGTNTAVFPVEEGEELGDDEMPDFLPQWKGNDQVTCLVAAKSHFLAAQDGTAHRRNEVVVVGLDGTLKKVLSADWPDEAIPSTED